INGDQAACTVIKDAGDDADITHAKEIGCEISLSKNKGQEIAFKQGEGVGRATIQGLPIDVGEPAINPVPRRMIEEALYSLAGKYNINKKIVVTPFVPEGKKMAEKTFNSRVGIVEGISILGTTGKVTPYSEDAFIAAIKNQLSIVKQTGYNEVVLTSGKRSETLLKDEFQHLPDFAFIHFGNLVGETLKLVNQYKIPKVNLGLMFGKSIKLAEGHLDTHSKKVSFNPSFASDIAEQCGHSNTVISKIQQQIIANAIFNIIPYSADSCYYINVAKHCYQHCKNVLFAKTPFTFILLTEKGENIFYPRGEN
ncbi:MAG: cobalt-precorrin-5B (C(1))-methyltransferase CbiD, partial [Bacteroidota bacterium]